MTAIYSSRGFFLILCRTCTWRPATADGVFFSSSNLVQNCTWRAATLTVFFLRILCRTVRDGQLHWRYFFLLILCRTCTWRPATLTVFFSSNLVQNCTWRAATLTVFFLLILCRTCTWRPATTGKAVSCTMTTFWPVTTARLSTSPPPALTAKSSSGTWRPRRCLPDCAKANQPTCRWREGKGCPTFVPMDICPMGKISLCLRGTSSVTATCYRVR